ncbi:MAG: hypothetical protein ACFFBY_07150 [Promethearchaeota archaeon]
MHEKDRNRIILEAKKYGGLGLRSQMIRVHKNGAKFTISKVYLEDKLINPDASYSLILIPEAKVSSKLGVIITYFHRKKGPLIFYSYPEDVFTEREKYNASNLIEPAIKEKFFTYQTVFFSSMNYYFEIDSDWSWGNKEILMVTIVLNTSINEVIEENIELLCQELEIKFQDSEHIYKGFWMERLDEIKGVGSNKQEIESKAKLIRAYIKEFYNEIQISISTIKG